MSDVAVAVGAGVGIGAEFGAEVGVWGLGRGDWATAKAIVATHARIGVVVSPILWRTHMA